jgi:hypothetical protein
MVKFCWDWIKPTINKANKELRIFFMKINFKLMYVFTAFSEPFCGEY